VGARLPSQWFVASGGQTWYCFQVSILQGGYSASADRLLSLRKQGRESSWPLGATLPATRNSRYLVGFMSTTSKAQGTTASMNLR